MRTVRGFALPAALCFLALIAACRSTPPPTTEPKISPINNSDVFKLAQDALQPIVDQYIDRGDRILLINVPAFDGIDAWRFVPTPVGVKEEDYEGTILPNARKLFKPPADDPRGEVPELKLLDQLFTHDGGKKVYTLKTTGDAYNELLLGRTLAGAGYSGVGHFSLGAFARAHPYFIDAFEGGMLAAVLKKQGKGFERLAAASMDSTDVPAAIRKPMLDTRTGQPVARSSLVFNTDPAAFNTWSAIQDAYKPNAIAKMLLYSINNVVSSDTTSIGIQASFRLVDVARGGRLLWSGVKSLTSAKFPREKVPYLGTVRLTLPQQVMTAQKDGFAGTLRDQGIKSMTAVLVKIDDIPIFGSYPVTREDYAVESALEAFFAGIALGPGQQVSVMDKLYPRQYKEPWQLAHAVHYVNPLLGGDYSQFSRYYGAQYMIGYRILWKKLQGVQLLQGDKELELSGKILGIYVKIMDMADNGRIVLSDMLTLGTDAELQDNALYRCYERTKGFSALAAALRGAGIVTDATHSSIINRRMEIANNYIGEKTSSEEFMLQRMSGITDPTALMMATYDAYEVLRTFGTPVAAPKKSFWDLLFPKKAEEPSWTQEQELNAMIAVNLMQTWFEDGLCTALVAGDAAPNEKMESLYSRALLEKSVSFPAAPFSDVQQNTPEELLYLSPLLLSKWGSLLPLRTYYGIDKIIYFSLLETGTPAAASLTTPPTSPLARFFPVIASDPDSLQVSVVNVVSGDYEFKQDFPLK
jgi:hypothetical protein